MMSCVRVVDAAPDGVNSRDRRRVRRRRDRVERALAPFLPFARMPHRVLMSGLDAMLHFPGRMACAIPSDQTAFVAFETIGGALDAIQSVQASLMVDPHAVDIVYTHPPSFSDVSRHCAEYGTIAFLHKDAERRRIRVTFMDRSSQLACLLRDSTRRTIGAVPCRVEPVFVENVFEGTPAPWSPARMFMSS